MHYLGVSMEYDTIEKAVAAILFIISIVGVFYKLKGHVQSNAKDIAHNNEQLHEIFEDLKSIREISVDEIKKELINCKLTEQRVESLDRSLQIFSDKLEKNFDESRSMIGKLFEKLERKEDKK